MMKHACQDADVTMRLYPILLEQLRERGITEQFSGHTLPLVTRFGDLEFEGISVDPGRMEVIRRSLIAKATRLKSRIIGELGKAFDLDSDRELWAVLREALLSKGYLAPGRITTSILEQLAISEPLVQLVVEYKRFRSRILVWIQSRQRCVVKGSTRFLARQNLVPALRRRSGRTSLTWIRCRNLGFASMGAFMTISEIEGGRWMRWLR
jgi:DNA polymerase I